MKFVDLAPCFLAIHDRDGGRHVDHVSTLAEADAIRFTCPGCGKHEIVIPFKGRNWDGKGTANGWDVSGTGYADLTLHPSVLLVAGHEGDCHWHGFITNGESRTV